MEAQGTAPSKKNGGGPSAACRLTPGHVRRGDAVGVGFTAVRRAGETKLHAFTEGVRMAKDIWAPWRIEYILGPKSGDCAFCLPEMAPGPERDAEDRRRLVVWRGRRLFVMLNRYPYAAGHLMIIPLRHVPDITELDAEESAEMMALVQLSCRALRELCRPQGINVGLNLGEAAGAGIREHVHMHVVPRWNGDSSFMAVLDDVRVIPEHLERTRERLYPVFKRLGSAPGRIE